VGKALVDMNRLTDQVEDLPENIAAERQAIVAILDERKDLFGDTLSELRGVLSDANMAATTLDQASRSLDEMLVRATAFISLFIRPDDASSTTPPHPFDIREYTVAAESLTVAANKINDMLRSSEALIGSSEWDHRLQQVNDSADDRMRMAAKQSEQVLHDIFWRACVVVGMLCATVIVCLALALLILRRRRGRKNAGQSSQVARIER
jgi:small-conductance mechanosensitive channel